VHEGAKDREYSIHAWGDNSKQNRGQENPVGKALLEDQVWMEINFTVGMKETGCGGEDGYCWYRIRSSSRILWTQQWILGFHQRLGISWISERLFGLRKSTASRVRCLWSTSNAVHIQFFWMSLEESIILWKMPYRPVVENHIALPCWTWYVDGRLLYVPTCC